MAPALFLGKALSAATSSESHITAQLAKMMSVRELQILGEEREEEDRKGCSESLVAFGLGKNVIVGSHRASTPSSAQV